ncbi:ribosomal protein S18-alanine N-acetyltransferase [Peptoniphilus stercorisuis]|uniref:[Ribosomal protein bS18]-alanine N-acetyltransferase n=1 Tax=Peptoniphilus stercorisuis TaxID=1436965 RepID=A0ABS4KBU5_9FIRM|nr:ribosomal protein S18-alanine N-acetyltransferase [Peptoniphilus stercorisuis]MBP2024825.1 ribosomal-protein-alanine N-acetyltransferase [Peptoniphilus stercorisuis]
MKKEIIRLAIGSDLDRILEIENHSFDTPWSRESLRIEIEENELSEVYIIENDFDILGYMGYMKIFDEAHITNIAIDKKYRGLGYGRKLVEEVVEKLKEEDFNITLEVSEKNKAARNLYESLGFEEAGIRKDYYKIGDNALIMWNRR